ncbi:exodeoxyribonuclease VII large subunit [Caminibacter mediatlanticus TB-2]|uniref:Exodeoxyribonuclease 7 large subunit n=1 Tax=Caminibacter mediatlanticus TB-2 TaxID=391592 RepID=A0ABX5V7T9_9BACT|nr:exodeoxyribonuclease VII large subunit [Caminibacter mediatlanticus]QCT94338.1 exodeoxyribonuclease VII large subunit [Caminibacter mediatlanticus TB-2]
MKPITVSGLNTQIKSILESHFEIVYVEGEVSKVTYHSSGHMYFTIKDEKSAINCAMWKSNLSKMKFKLKVGDKILVYGAINLYIPRGEYKLIAQSITPSGIGELQLAFERLKEELSKLGYFDIEKKKPLPKFPKRIALITSSTGAALQDMLRVAKKRWLLSKFYLFDVLVQGDGAAEDIARKIKKADEYIFDDGDGFDLIIVGRGGGSKEDLWAFNERVVADAIYEAKTPIISAVGHEIDYLISDFVADKRAATPSNAIEIALPDKNEMLMMIDEMINSFNFRYETILHKKEKILSHLFELFEANSIFNKLLEKQREIKFTKNQYLSKINSIIEKKENNLINLRKAFEIMSPLKKLHQQKEKMEFLKTSIKSVTSEILKMKEKQLNSLKELFEISNPKKREKEGFGEIIKNNKRVSLNEIKIDDIFFIENTKITIKAKALDKKERDVL